MASGSEVEQCVQAQALLAEQGVAARVISMPCFELYEQQSDEYKESVMPNKVRARVAVEAAVSFGWHKYVGLDGATVTLDHFGASAPGGAAVQEGRLHGRERGGHRAEGTGQVMMCMRAEMCAPDGGVQRR